MSCIFYSCSAPKKIVEPKPTVVTKKLEFDPAIHFDESALRLYRLAKAFPFSVQQKMQYASKDSVQIRFTKFAKASVGFLKNGEDIFQPQKNAMVDAGLVNKLFLALACAKKMKIYGASAVSYNSTMITEAAGKNLPGSYNDWYAPKGRPNIGQYLRRMLTQNDVEAYNRILELVTIPYLNEFVKANGWNATLINSRLGRQYSAGENATMNLINFYDDNNRKIYSQQSSVNNAVNHTKDFKNSTSLADVESMLQAIFNDKQKEVSLAKEIGEEQLEYIRVLLLNVQGEAQEDEANLVRGNASLFFPKIKHDKNLIVVPLKTISDKGMCEVVYFFNTISSKHFILSASLVFKPYNTVAQYEKQLQEGRQFFEDLGKAVLVD